MIIVIANKMKQSKSEFVNFPNNNVAFASAYSPQSVRAVGKPIVGIFLNVNARG